MSDIDLSEIKKILIIIMGGIGDMIFLTPALKALRNTLPYSKISYLLGPYGAEKVIEGSNLLDKKIIVHPEKYRGIKGKIKLIQEFQKERFDLSVSSSGNNPIKNGLLSYMAGIKYRAGENIGQKGLFYNLKIPFNRNNHEVEGNIRLMQRIGIKVHDKSLYVYRSSEDRDLAQRNIAKNNLNGKLVIGMHPGSGRHQAAFRRWPKENFALLADLLVQKYKASIILFGGADEISLSENIKKMMQANPLIMTGKTTLSQTAALIEKCNLFISNDSGLMHVACAANTPTIGIYGPTDYKRTGPYSDSAIVIRKELDCSPCYKRGKIKCKELDCFKLITVEKVLEVVDGLLRKKQEVNWNILI